MMAEDNRSHRFIKGVGFNAAGGIVSIVLNFATLIVAVRLIPKNEFGVFTLLSVVALFFVMIGDFGMENTIVRFVAAEKEEKKQIVQTSLGGRLVIALLISLLILALRSIIASIFHSALLAHMILFVPAMFVLQYVYIALEGFLLGLHLYKRVAITKIIVSSTRFALVALFLLYAQWELMGLLFAFIISWAVACALAYLFLPWIVLPKIDFALFKRMLRFGLPLQINKILAFIFDRIDTVMLGAMLNPLSVAAYEVGYKIPEGSRRIFNSFRQVYFSHMSELHGNNEEQRAEAILTASLRFTSFSMAFGALCAGLFHRQIITLLFSQRYAESGIVLLILMVGLTIGLCNHLLGNMLIASGSPKKILVPSVSESLLNVVGNLLLIPLWGIVGAAIASLISRIAVNPIFLLLCRKGRRLTIARSYLRSFIILIFCLILFYLFGPRGVCYKLSLLGLFIILNVICKVVTKEEVLLLRSSVLSARVR